MSRRISIKYSDAVTVIPTWLNADYFLEILKKYEPNFKKIQHFNVFPAAAAGEHYASLLLRISIDAELRDGSTKSYSYVLKSMLETENAAVFIKLLGQFPKEQEMYAKLLPQFEYLFKEVGSCVKFGPTCLRTEETPKRITLILDDLKERNFEHVNRLIGLDMMHMEAALMKLAEFHAASVMWHQRNGSFGQQFNVGLVSERSRKFFEERFALLLEAFKSSIKLWGFNEMDTNKYQQKVPTAQQYVDELINLGQIDKSAFNVLNHGDIWCNNIMFNYKVDETIENTYFVDYQLCKYGPPSYDLYLLILSSAQQEVKVSQFINFLRCYQSHLQQCLEKLKFTGDIPTLDDLKDLLSRDRFYAFFVISGYLPVILMPPSQESTVEVRMRGGENAQKARLESMRNPLYAKQMEILMPWLCDGGFLDL